MMASINPLGERARGHRWWRTAAAFSAGCLFGGAALGAAAGGAGRLAALRAVLPSGTAASIAAAVVLTAGAVELVGWRVPTVRRQVDEAWLARYRGWVYGGGYGVQLGAGVATTVTTAAVYAVAGLAAVLGATGRLGWAVTVGGAFGLARTVPVLVGATVRDPAHLRRRAARVAAAAGASRVATGSSLCALALWAAASH